MRRLSLCCLLLVCACGSTNYNDVSNLIAACESWSHAACQVESTCNPGNVDVDSCTQLVAHNAQCSTASCGVGFVYSPAAGQACLTAYENQDCEDSGAGTQPSGCAAGVVCVAQ